VASREIPRGTRQEGHSELMDSETSTHPPHVDRGVHPDSIGAVTNKMEEVEVQEWLESLDSVLESSGPEVAMHILERLRAHATVAGVTLPFTANTP